MILFSYTKSPELSESLTYIERLRRELLLTPLSVNTQLKVKWESTVDRIYFALALDEVDVDKKKIITAISPAGTRGKDATTQIIRQYKEALDYIYFDWLASPTPINLDTIITLYRIISNERMKISTYDFERGLQYAQIKPEHPLIQASIMQMLISSFQPFESHNDLLGTLLFQLVLSKYGFDCRGMVVMEEFLYQRKAEFHQIMTDAIKNNNVTPWLEFVTRGFHHQLEHTVRYVHSLNNTGTNVSDSFFILTDRQKAIVGMLDEPGSQVTNQKVQKLFHISQITASRELARLSELGLLFPVGKGRSTAYTKA